MKPTPHNPDNADIGLVTWTKGYSKFFENGMDIFLAAFPDRANCRTTTRME
jgi:hypothetical protein